MAEKPILLSEKQFETLKLFFSDDIVWQRIDAEWEKTSIRVDDILYWGWARWWKSWLIWTLIAICIKAFPWSSWLVARTELAALKATTLATTFKVLHQFGITPTDRKDKVKDEKNIEFTYWADIVKSEKTRLYVIQVNAEPKDPEFDKVGSFDFTGVFLDEAQQMVLTLKEALDWRLSNLNGFFEKEIPEHYYDSEWNLKSLIDEPPENIEAFIEFPIKIIWEVTRAWEQPVWKDYKEVVPQWGQFCHVKRVESLIIPYTFVSSRIAKKWNWRHKYDQLVHRYSWSFKWCIFSSCNPWRNFTYTEFYHPYSKWLLKTDPNLMNRAFIPAIATDNPFVDKAYVDRLKRLPETSVRKQRLLYGNFEYNDDDSYWFSSQTTMTAFSWLVGYKTSHIRYAVIDVARKGKDSTEIWLFEWMHMYKIVTIKKWLLTEQSKQIIKILKDNNIDQSENTIADEVWVGWGLVDLLGCKWFIGNASPIQKKVASKVPYLRQNFANLRSQAFWYLAEYCRRWYLRITCTKEEQEEIQNQLSLMREVDMDKDSKVKLEDKSVIIRELKWKSPDKADMLSMRMRWVIKDYMAWLSPEEDIKKKIGKALTPADMIIMEIEESDKKKKWNNFWNMSEFQLGEEFDIYW